MMDTVQVPSRTALPNRSQYTESVLMLDFRKLYKIKSSISSKSSVTPDVRLHTSRIEANKQQPQQGVALGVLDDLGFAWEKQRLYNLRTRITMLQ